MCKIVMQYFQSQIIWAIEVYFIINPSEIILDG